VQDYAHAPEDHLEVATTNVSADTGRMEIDGLVPPQALRAPVAVEMLAVHVDGTAVPCRAETVELTVRYLQRDNSSREDFSHVVRVPVTDGAAAPSVAYIPVYVFAHNPYVRFA